MSLVFIYLFYYKLARFSWNNESTLQMKVPAVWEKNLVPWFFKYLERYIMSANLDWIYYFGLRIWKSLLFFSREETKNQSIHRNTGLSNVWTNNKLNPYNTKLKSHQGHTDGRGVLSSLHHPCSPNAPKPCLPFTKSFLALRVQHPTYPLSK